MTRARTVTRRSLLTTAARTAAAAPLALASCGIGSSAQSGPATVSGDMTGKFVIALVGAEQQHPPAILDGYKTKFPKLNVETISGAWNPTLDKIAEMVAAGTPPDVWYGEDGRATGWGPRAGSATLLPTPSAI